MVGLLQELALYRIMVGLLQELAQYRIMVDNGAVTRTSPV